LVVLFLVAYQFAAGVKEGAHGRPGEVAAVDGWWSVGVSFGAFAVVIMVFFLMVQPLRKAQRLHLDAASLVSRGRHFDAQKILAEAARLAPKASGLPLLRGYALACLWRLDEADEALGLATKLAGGIGQPNLSKLRAPYHALVKALAGQLEPAAVLLREAESVGAGDDPHVTLARVAVAARSGEWELAEKLSRQTELQQLGGVLRGLAEALASWAAVARGQPGAPVNRAAALGEAGTDAVKKFWPEFAAFLEVANQPVRPTAAQGAPQG
jgi:hypothetical protein